MKYNNLRKISNQLTIGNMFVLREWIAEGLDEEATQHHRTIQ